MGAHPTSRAAGIAALDAECADAFAELARRPATAVSAFASGHLPVQGGVNVATFQGFGQDDRALVGGVAALPGEVLSARSVVALRSDMRGMPVVLAFEDGDVRRPIVLGVLVEAHAAPDAAAEARTSAWSAEADGDRVVVSAEREVVLQCGEASITLTRSGKVLIKGNHVLSRSMGNNRIKGATVEIN